MERSLYYFAQYVDDRLSDPAVPRRVSRIAGTSCSPDDGSGDLVHPPEAHEEQHRDGHTPHDEYRSPLSTRYAGRGDAASSSPSGTRIRTWRRLWIWLAEAQAELGLDIRPEQIAAMEAAIEDIDFEKAAAYEARFRHDVMAHVHAFGDAAPGAGASSTSARPPAT